MDLSKVKEIITPLGSLKKILRGNVTIWSKNTDLKYTIWKNGVLIDKVTMPQFMNKIQNGSARTDYGIGAQIMIPYTDPFNNITYDCPFNFGTFTSYPGKLGLQSHYALPTATAAYWSLAASVTVSQGYLIEPEWSKSKPKQWLNLDSGTMSFGQRNVKGFLSCVPEDFVEVLQTIETGPENTQCKVFLLTATQYCIDASDWYESSSKSYPCVICNHPESEGQVWEYWKNRIGTPQIYDTTNDNRIVYSIGKNTTAGAMTHAATSVKLLTTCLWRTYTGSKRQSLYGFNSSGKITVAPTGSISNSSNTIRYQPACVIG